LVLEAYTILVKLATEHESNELLDQLDLVRSKFDEGCRIFGPAVSAAELATADRGLIAERDSLAAALNKLLNEYQALVAANSKPGMAGVASDDRQR
jgi:hypothetical protein